MSRETAVRTPGPWTTEAKAHRACIARVGPATVWTERACRAGETYEWGEPEDDAAFIVKACNAHEALVEALKPLASIPVEKFGWDKNPDRPVHGWNGFELYTRDVLAARAALALATGEAK